MGDGFNITIGMSTKTIMSNLNNLAGATGKTKQMIINFCNSDLDDKVSNDIELSMLNAWTNGSTRIKMPEKPTEKDYEVYSNEKLRGRRTVVYTRQSDQMHFDNFTKDKANFVTYSHCDENVCISDNLTDIDGDGYADSRNLTISNSNGGNACTYRDINMNGKFDEIEKE